MLSFRYFRPHCKPWFYSTLARKCPPPPNSPLCMKHRCNLLFTMLDLHILQASFAVWKHWFAIYEEKKFIHAGNLPSKTFHNTFTHKSVSFSVTQGIFDFLLKTLMWQLWLNIFPVTVSQRWRCAAKMSCWNALCRPLHWVGIIRLHWVNRMFPLVRSLCQCTLVFSNLAL